MEEEGKRSEKDKVLKKERKRRSRRYRSSRKREE